MTPIQDTRKSFLLFLYDLEVLVGSVDSVLSH